MSDINYKELIIKKLQDINDKERLIKIYTFVDAWIEEGK